MRGEMTDRSMTTAHGGDAPGHPGKRVAVVVPPVVCHDLDPHTGIPFMPHMAAHLAGMIRACGYALQVFDSFGMEPNRRELIGEFMLMGVPAERVARQLDPATEVCWIYCRTIAEFIAVERLIAAVKLHHPDVKIVLFENIQAVTSYSLKPVAKEWIGKGADVVVMGEPERRADDVTRKLIDGEEPTGIKGVAFRAADGDVLVTEDAPLDDDLDGLPLPAWEIFPLAGYWRAGFAHAPCSGERFLPILTSRGCPFRCTFCIAPTVNSKWRAHSAARVVDEMAHFHDTLGVTDFHVSDLDPTVSDRRIREICHEIIRRKLPITWKLAQGTKIETIKNEETMELMAKAGCVFISFSPESGSKALLKIMNKPFDHAHGLRMVRCMARLGIRSQAVFLGGVPGETLEDRQQSLDYARQLLSAGLDELSLVIFTPLPGVALADTLQGYRHYSACTPSPNWREDYADLLRYRRQMYIALFSHRFLRRHKILATLRNLLLRRFETKMEMSLFKQVKLYVLKYAPWMLRGVAGPVSTERPGS